MEYKLDMRSEAFLWMSKMKEYQTLMDHSEKRQINLSILFVELKISKIFTRKKVLCTEPMEGKKTAGNQYVHSRGQIPPGKLSPIILLGAKLAAESMAVGSEPAFVVLQSLVTML